MKSRIEKKLSKRLAKECPNLFPDAGCDEEGFMCVEMGGDCWYECGDVYTCFEFLKDSYEWLGDFKTGSDGFPDISGFKPTAKNLLNLARDAEARLVANAVKRSDSTWWIGKMGVSK